VPIPFLAPGDDLNNREIAAAFWFAALAVFVLARRDTRGPAMRTVGALLQRMIVLSLAAMAAWVVLMAVLGSRWGLWTSDLVKDTALWFLTFAVVRLFRMTNVGKDRHPFRDMILDPLAATALVEFITNLYVFPLPVEVVLIPMITILGLLALVAGYQKVPYVKGIANAALAAIGIAILSISAFDLVTRWPTLDVAHQVRLLVLPVWLTAATAPYLCAMSLLAGYESAFLRIAFASPNRKIAFRSRLAMFTVLTIRTRAVANFRAPWIGRLAEAGSLEEARTVLHDYLRRDPDQAAPAASR
jgi:hypothetical protein